MGFRSTFTIQDYNITWPDWFVKKYSDYVWFSKDSGVIASKMEAKVHGLFSELCTDIQKAIDWDDFVLKNIVLVYLHECGGITRCQISRDDILYSEPWEWEPTKGVRHSYCYGCSDM